ncbi:mitogen-activated protein kinase kinase kinase NPK1 [Artemisia annua]|uniref:mitogen-activated protein kinase kinase kinase n=1 Tax=Artemisia annua TaxID=35608 RepID=A0A2U1MQG7_ARTAN|nr:mitogen-activated protein kinase kinase kinase NPK1 [Artemisia annua]
MQDFLGSVRRSLVFKPNHNDDPGVGNSFGGFVEKIGSSIRKSKIGLFSKANNVQALPPPRVEKSKKKNNDEAGSQIRWRKGELIGCGAFGRVYMGMNLDSGELLAVKQVSVVVNVASKDKTQVSVVVNVASKDKTQRYLGTAREEESLNIFLEFVPGGSISSLLGKFGSFPESVIRMYTKQILLGLEYLHKNGIMHRDIKGANILVDNKGRIKLADFGASKKVVELATMTGAKSMKGTPYWMAPEVIVQTGHSFSADIWSVGCTVIEMATGKPPWSQQYQEVAALFHIGTTKAHPPIPDHLSAEAKDFLLKCLEGEPNLRPDASELLQHPFVTAEYNETHPVFRASVMVTPENQIPTSRMEPKNLISPEINRSGGIVDAHGINSVRCSTIYPDKSCGAPMWGSSRYDDDMCQMDDDDLMAGTSMKLDSTLVSNDVNKSFNPMMEPDDDWPCQFDGSPELDKSACQFDASPELGKSATNLFPDQVSEMTTESPLDNGDNGFTFPNGASGMDEEEEVTEIKIRAFLDEKALDLKKMQTPLYEEFYNSMNPAISPVVNENKENLLNNSNLLPPKSKSPNRLFRKRLSSAVDVSCISSPGNKSERHSNIGGANDQNPLECRSPQNGQLKENNLDSQKEAMSPSASFAERQRRWKEELAEELERKRELMRQAGVVKTASPKDQMIRTRSKRFMYPGN